MTGPPAPPQDRRRYDRRTGAALLALMASSNVVPWMEILLGQTTTSELLTPSEIRLAIGTCLLALLVVLAVWLSGRRGVISESPLFREPRSAGLLFSGAAVAGNILLAAAIRTGGFRVFPALAQLTVFACVWYVVILPLEAAAGFALGRAGRMPGRRRPQGSDAAARL